ncbi:MAG: MFS transporter [Novosphingobium sp.]|nr:MFS transporter [Novosphingobium sp.]
MNGERALRKGFYGWRLVAAFWAIMAVNLALPMYGLSFLNVYMADEFHFSRTTLAVAYALFMAMTGLPGPLVAKLIAKVGIRNTLALGNFLLAAAAAAMATIVTTPVMLLLVAGIAIGTSDAIGGPIPAQAGVTFWFVRRRSLALAVVLSGGTIGGVVSAPLLEKVVAAANGDWRYGWWLIAVFALLASAISLLFVKDRPEDIGQSPDGGAESALEEGVPAEAHNVRRRVHLTTQDWTSGQVLRSPAFWLLMLCAVGFSGAYVIFLAQGALQIRDLGYSLQTAAYLLSAAVAIGLAAHMAAGYLGDRIDPQYLWVAAMACQATGIVLFAHANHPWLLYASVALLGIGGSSSMVCMVTLLGNWFGARAYASVYGLASAVQSTLGAAAPVLAGAYYDRFGTFTPVLYGVGIGCAAGAVLLLALRPPVHPDAPLGAAFPADSTLLPD